MLTSLKNSYRDNNGRFKKYERKVIFCSCGCGKSLLNRSEKGELRKYIWGHGGNKFAKGHKTNKGKKFSEEVRKKMSQARLGMKFSEEHKRKISEVKKGKKYPDRKSPPSVPLEVRERIRKAMSGANGPGWKGGVTPINTGIRNSARYAYWRKDVFQKDNYTCQKTGVEGGKLVPHHISNFADYPELRLEISNGITLSKKAHEEFHKIYGKKNNTKEQLEEFLMS